jgi:hypothetical protein
MLFDLRSRGRRRTVQVIYAGLALLMFGGLILFGVGAGNGFGGLLNAFTGSGSGSSKQVATQEQKAALKATRLNPESPAAWASLVSANWSAANQSSAQDTNGLTVYTAAGKKDLAATVAAWNRYLQTTRKPDAITATLAARAHSRLSQFGPAATAWEYAAAAQPTSVGAFFCLAANAYAANQTRKGDLAAAQAVKVAPKVSQLSLKQQLAAAKTTPAVAQEC